MITLVVVEDIHADILPSICHSKNSNSIEFNATDIMLSHLVLSLSKLVAATCQQNTLHLAICIWRWAWGLCGGPDVPHAALSVSTVNTESRGVGIKQSQLSVSSHIVQEDELLKAVRSNEPLRLTFTLHLTESTSVEWETVAWRRCLYIRVPSCLLPEGSKEGFVSLLEYAEETLRCTNIIVCLRKDRSDRAMLVRTFMFLGFTVLPPTHALVPPGSDAGNLYMLYAIE
ncbi:ornithine decarboxylase antizyme 1 [Mycetomoellerius zeteki]|nr:PREDICTED: ornithine decarboxylase antizyme 1 [Trachymyrmex zeteki]